MRPDFLFFFFNKIKFSEQVSKRSARGMESVWVGSH